MNINLDQPLVAARREFEIQYIEYQLEKHKGNITHSATAIGMDRSALHRKMNDLGI